MPNLPGNCCNQTHVAVVVRRIAEVVLVADSRCSCAGVVVVVVYAMMSKFPLQSERWVDIRILAARVLRLLRGRDPVSPIVLRRIGGHVYRSREAI